MTTTDLTRKYRPKTFDKVSGNKAQITALQSVVEAEGASTYLLSGPSGVGKTTLGRIIADSLNYELVEVDGAVNTGVDAARDLVRGAHLRSLGAKRGRVYLIDEAHQLSTSAFNALLKVTEEPPPGVIWVLATTEPGKILPTIRNRAHRVALEALDDDDLLDLLIHVDSEEGIGFDDDALMLVAKASEGSARRSLRNLAAVRDFDDLDQLKSFLGAAEAAEKDTRALCRALNSHETTWRDLTKVVKGIPKVNPEGIRIQVCAYFVKVALDQSKAGRALQVLEAFADPYPPGAKLEHLLISLHDSLG